jgi:nitronate monooxygenase
MVSVARVHADERLRPSARERTFNVKLTSWDSAFLRGASSIRGRSISGVPQPGDVAMPVPEAFKSLRIPAVAAPMFLTSGPSLVIECCKAGVLGTFPALNQRTTEGFAAWLGEIRSELARHTETTGRPAAPFGVNLIVHKTNPRVMADLEVCAEHKVPLVITSLGAASEVVQKVHNYGGLVFHDVTTAKHARKAAEAGADGLILVAAGAGGHAGTWSPFALISEIREFFSGTLLLAGCISSGRDIAAAQMMGADLAYMGTRFIATQEALVSQEYKDMIVAAGAADILYTPAISSVPASFLRQSVVAAGLDPDKLAPPAGVDLSHITEPYKKDLKNQKAWRDIWSAGQGVGSIHDLPPTRELVERLIAEYQTASAEFERNSARFR